MRLCSSLGTILVFAYLQSAVAQDTMWVCRDTGQESMYMHMFLADTFPDNRGQFAMVDTGDEIDGLLYQF